MLGVLLAPAMQQAQRELVLVTDLGRTLLTRRDLLRQISSLNSRLNVRPGILLSS